MIAAQAKKRSLEILTQRETLGDRIMRRIEKAANNGEFDIETEKSTNSAEISRLKEKYQALGYTVSKHKDPTTDYRSGVQEYFLKISWAEF